MAVDIEAILGVGYHERTHGWLAPDGTLVPVQPESNINHQALAERIVDILYTAEFVPESPLHWYAETEFLLEKNWIRVDHVSKCNDPATMTLAQSKTLRKLHYGGYTDASDILYSKAAIQTARERWNRGE